MYQPLHKAVFFDRDGVLVKTTVKQGKPYAVRAVEDFQIFPEALSVIQFFKKQEYKIVVVTNQPDVGNGLVDQAVVAEMHQILLNKLPIDLIKVCYHNKNENCLCRKPKSGMLHEAAQALDINLTNSIMVGDRDSDMIAGKSVGCFTIFIDYAYNEPRTIQPDKVVNSLGEVVTVI